jgi:UDP-N-acetylglucosamine--N-acetylmuramyl-(pentapeptide) pyrophosphoryl-undecaprenol N-acetylglucosamine transferase
MIKKILITTGGTGGHIFPALALKKFLEEKTLNVKVTGDEKFARFHNFDIEHIYIPSAHFSYRSPLQLLKSAIKISLGILKSLKLLIQYKPDLIIGFGGYATFPVLIATRILNYPFILHEANTVMGKVNKIFAKKALYITTGFEKTYGIESSCKQFFVGNPVRDGITFKNKENNTDCFNIVIIGGSQGAKSFSKLIPDAIINLPQEIKQRIHIYQQVKEEDIAILQDCYNKKNIASTIQSFFSNMDEILAKADLLIARAGASTIAEVIKTRTPTIFIPYPFASDKHQHSNALEISNHQAGWLVPESEQTSTEILKLLKQILAKPELLEFCSQNLEKLDKDACNNIYELVSKN